MKGVLEQEFSDIKIIPQNKMITKSSITCIDDSEFLSVMETDMNYLDKYKYLCLFK